MLDSVAAKPLDSGTEHFQPSAAVITTVDVGNPASNIIPATARATFNIRFNDRHSGESLARHLRESFDAVRAELGGEYELTLDISGESFLSRPGPLAGILSEAIEARLGVKPALNTAGGTSDARFISKHCPVAEFGLVGATAHKVDEFVALADLDALAAVYTDVLERFFAHAAKAGR